MTLRVRIVAGVAAILAASLAVAFVAVYRGAAAEVRRGVDRDLSADMDAFARSLPADRRLAAVVRRYVVNQPFHATGRLLFARLGGDVITNEPELLKTGQPEAGESGAEQAREDRAARATLAAPRGFSEVFLPDAGRLRVLVRTLRDRGGRSVRLGVAEPLHSVLRAKEGIRHAFVAAAGLALAAALIGGMGLAAGVSRPLRRMAGVAVRVDAGDLAPRMAERGPHDEVRRLADAFDHMLDRLRESFDRQTAFVADASHELRTPLTVIRGQLEVLARESRPQPEDIRRVERLVLGEVDRMSRMVDDLLVLAAPQVRAQELDLQALLAELVESMAATADRRFVLRAAPAGTLHADPDRLAQAVRNLLRNAVEHTGEGGRIEVEAVAAHGRVVMRVDDDGPGIPPAERDRIFDRFHRGDPDRARRGGGTGLGLAIVGAVAEAHGGRVWADASPLGGARVAIELPGFTAGE